MDEESICQQCLRKDCPYKQTFYGFWKYTGIVLRTITCPAYLAQDNNTPQDDGKKEWA